MNKALKKALSIGASFALMLCLIFTSTISVFAAYQDGTYSVGMSCEGGSGRGGVESAMVTVIGGSPSSIALTMTSPNYDYCYDPVTGAKVLAPAGSGNSVFYINYPGTTFSFTADTTAMSQPYEITYIVYLDLSGIPIAQSEDPTPSGGSEGSGGSGGYTPSGPSEEEKAKAELEKKLAAADALIEEIGDVSINSRDAIKAAREAVDAFTAEEQKGLKKLSVLEDAEKKLAEIEKKIADADALIEKIGDDISLDSQSDIEAARKAVNDLSEDEKKELKNLTKLQSAEDIFKEVKEAAEKAAAEAARKKEILSYVAAGAVVLVVLIIVIGINIKKGKKQ